MAMESGPARPRDYWTCEAPPPPLLPSRPCGHRLYRDRGAVHFSRYFCLRPRQIVQLIERGLIRGLERVDFVAGDECVLRSMLHADARAIRGLPFHFVFRPTHGVADFAGQGLALAGSQRWNACQSD